MSYVFHIIHLAGTVHQAADALLRIPNTQSDGNPLEDDSPIQCIIKTEADDFVTEPEFDAYYELEDEGIYDICPSAKRKRYADDIKVHFCTNK